MTFIGSALSAGEAERANGPRQFQLPHASNRCFRFALYIYYLYRISHSRSTPSTDSVHQQSLYSKSEHTSILMQQRDSTIYLRATVPSSIDASKWVEPQPQHAPPTTGTALGSEPFKASAPKTAIVTAVVIKHSSSATVSRVGNGPSRKIVVFSSEKRKRTSLAFTALSCPYSSSAASSSAAASPEPVAARV